MSSIERIMASLPGADTRSRRLRDLLTDILLDLNSVGLETQGVASAIGYVARAHPSKAAALESLVSDLKDGHKTLARVADRFLQASAEIECLMLDVASARQNAKGAK